MVVLFHVTEVMMIIVTILRRFCVSMDQLQVSISLLRSRLFVMIVLRRMSIFRVLINVLRMHLL